MSNSFLNDDSKLNNFHNKKNNSDGYNERSTKNFPQNNKNFDLGERKDSGLLNNTLSFSNDDNNNFKNKLINSVDLISNFDSDATENRADSMIQTSPTSLLNNSENKPNKTINNNKIRYYSHRLNEASTVFNPTHHQPLKATSPVFDSQKKSYFHGSSHHISRSLPTSRRNSVDLTTFWNAMEALNINSSNRESKTKKEEILVRPQTPTDRSVPLNESVSPSVPPQFSDSFMMEDEASYSGNGGFSTLLRAERENFSGMLSSRSAALDLASLPQTSPRASKVNDVSLGNRKFFNINYKKFSKKKDQFCQISPPKFNNQIDLSKIKTKSPTNSISYRGDLSNFRGSNNSNNDFHENLEKNINKENITYQNIPTSPSNYNSNALNDYTSQQMQNPQQLLLHQQQILPKSNLCRYYLQGFCSRGDRCLFIHSNSSISVNNSQQQQLQPQLSSRPPHNAVTLNAPFNASSGFVYPGVNNYNQVVLYLGNRQIVFGNNGSQYLPVNDGNNNFNNLKGNSNSSTYFKQKRSNTDEINRLTNIPFEDLVGQICSLCKDQHGCRYLQKILEEKNEAHLNIIFHEIYPHFVDLMTDPFGNYLCQRLLEFCSDEQRSLLLECSSSELINMSLNMHGTRAVQKIVEYLNQPQQIRAMISALSRNTVILIKDLNGNHVIQKCLYRLTAEQNQFIFDAVSENCVEIATHRHGCCILQRCIDHASEKQRKQIVSEIIFNALTLVQDPYGNYVVQYVLDLAEGLFSDQVIRRFIGNVCLLSVQKFSSNVIEKCIRVSEPETRKYLIEEMINMERLDKLLMDSYANYVVQTALDFAENHQRVKLVECIRPLLQNIRNTPHGKRIFAKINKEQQHFQQQDRNGVGLIQQQNVGQQICGSFQPQQQSPVQQQFAFQQQQGGLHQQQLQQQSGLQQHPIYVMEQQRQKQEQRYEVGNIQGGDVGSSKSNDNGYNSKGNESINLASINPMLFQNSQGTTGNMPQNNIAGNGNGGNRNYYFPPQTIQQQQQQHHHQVQNQMGSSSNINQLAQLQQQNFYEHNNNQFQVIQQQQFMQEQQQLNQQQPQKQINLNFLYENNLENVY
ncbi:hypothetical protein HDU92_001786 [Lobulomyces angularis]|nr:hypothetical protein HDU92_001786 [Lobulomyces angularis]